MVDDNDKQVRDNTRDQIFVKDENEYDKNVDKQMINNNLDYNEYF